MELRKGSVVLTPAGRGTVVDRSLGESLVQLEEGSVFATTHGLWVADQQLTVLGFNPDAMVFSISRKVPAGSLLR